MAEYTENFNLEKQKGNDYVDIDGINGNFDIIDTEIKNAQDKVKNITNDVDGEPAFSYLTVGNRLKSSIVGENSTSLGVNNIASGMSSYVEGTDNQALSKNSHSEGEGNIVRGINSHAEGSINLASGNNSHAEGANNYTYASSSHAEGYYTQTGDSTTGISIGIGAHAEGYQTKALTNFSHAEGQGTIAKGDASHTEGVNTKTYSYYSHAEGQGSQAGGSSTDPSIGQMAHAEGYVTVAYGQSSHAEGDHTAAQGISSHAEGHGNYANGEYSHAEGHNNRSIGPASHTEGSRNIAININSHAEGDGNWAGQWAHAEGYGNFAAVGTSFKITAFNNTTKTVTLEKITGLTVGMKLQLRRIPVTDELLYQINITAINGLVVTLDTAAMIDSTWTHMVVISDSYPAHAEGYGTMALGYHSHAEGYVTNASGNCSHAEGNTTTASGGASHAGGYLTQVSGGNSFAHGLDLRANGNEQAIFGRYNIPNTTALLMIGNGTSDAARSDAFVIQDDGQAYVGWRTATLTMTTGSVLGSLRYCGNLPLVYNLQFTGLTIAANASLQVGTHSLPTNGQVKILPAIVVSSSSTLKGICNILIGINGNALSIMNGGVAIASTDLIILGNAIF
jgi:hypothetical protein